MNQRIFEELARQRQADMRRLAAGREFRSRAAAARAAAAPGVSASTGQVRDASQSLRARTGWWLVDLGLKLAVKPGSRSAASPRPVGS
jgi:hypothetical protein